MIDEILFYERSIGHVTLLAVPGLLISIILTAMLSFILPEIRNIGSFEVSHLQLGSFIISHEKIEFIEISRFGS